MLSSRSEIRPPTMTIAKGLCESAPMACDGAAGRSPRVAASIVIMMGRSLRTAPSTAASTIEWPRARSWLMYVDPDAHGRQFVAALCDMVPDQDVAIQAVHLPAIRRHSGRDPVVVIRRAHFVRIAVGERPANAGDEDGGARLQDSRLALLARQVRIHVQQIFGVQEGQLLRKVRILRLQLRKEILHVALGIDQDLPDLADDFL